MLSAHSFFPMRVVITIVCLTFCVVSCSTRPYKKRRAERLYYQGQQYLSKGEPEKAMEKFEDSLELAQMAEFKPGIAHNKNEMAIILTARGEFSKARTLLQESLVIYKELNMEPEISKTINNIAITYYRERNFKDALKEYEALLAWDGETNNMLGVGLTLYNMGTIYHNQLGQQDKAQEKYKEALAVFKDLGNEKYIRLLEQKIKTP